MRLNVEQPKSVKEGKDVEKPQDERAPVQRLVMWHLLPFVKTIAIYHRRAAYQLTTVTTPVTGLRLRTMT